jgi:hypothetical protein
MARITIKISLSTAIVENPHLDRWSCVKTGCAKGNGFTGSASWKKRCQISGFAMTAARHGEIGKGKFGDWPDNKMITPFDKTSLVVVMEYARRLQTVTI